MKLMAELGGGWLVSAWQQGLLDQKPFALCGPVSSDSALIACAFRCSEMMGTGWNAVCLKKNFQSNVRCVFKMHVKMQCVCFAYLLAVAFSTNCE